METLTENLQTKAKRHELDQIIQLVGFKLSDEEFGVNILQVREINRFVEITKIPESPEFVEGVVNLRGSVIPIISLRKRFRLDDKEIDNETRIIIIEVDQRMIGFIVDSVSEVLRIPLKSIEPPPSIVAGIDAVYLSGVCKLEDRLVIMLDMDRVLSEKELDQLEEKEENG